MGEHELAKAEPQSGVARQAPAAYTAGMAYFAPPSDLPQRRLATSITADFVERVTYLISKGLPKARACRLAGASSATFKQWMRWGAEADEGPYKILHDRVVAAEDGLALTACGTLSDLIQAEDSRGAEVPHGVRLSATKFLLSHRFSEEWSTKQSVVSTVQVEASVRVQPLVSIDQLATLTSEQLGEMVAALLKVVEKASS